MHVGQYIAKRLISSLQVLLVVSVLVFTLIRLVPGDPVVTMLGTDVSPKKVAELKALWGLDRPIYIQYGMWLSNVVRGDLGTSFRTDRKVLSSIVERLPVTLVLTVLSILISLVIAIPLGVLAALRQNSRMDYLAMTFSLLGVSIPNFWLGLLVLLLFSYYLRWFPTAGYVSIFDDVARGFRYMVLPAVTLGSSLAAIVTRMTRSSVLDVIRQPYVTTARAKGLRELLVVFRHVLKNALIPVVTVSGLQFAYLLGGAIVIEEVFSIPGMGMLILTAISGRDYVMVQGAVLFIALFFIIINLLVDILYIFLDPRIEYR
jgi:peptide/nickel transport system permease protein